MSSFKSSALVLSNKATPVTPTISGDISLVARDTHIYSYNGITEEQLAYTSEVASISAGIDARINTLENIIEATGEPVGFVNRTDSTLSYNPTTKAFAISGNYDVYVDGVKYTKTGESTTLTPISGSTYIKYGVNGVFDVSTTPWAIDENNAQIAYVFFNSDATDSVLFEERHGIVMDADTHHYLHFTQGAKFKSGFAIGDYLPLDSDVVANNKYSIATGDFFDEDILNVVPSLADGGPYTIFNRTGVDGGWTWSKAEAYPYFINSNSIRYNQNTGTTWQLTNITTNNRWVNYYVFATNGLTSGFGIIIIPGQAIYTTLALAQGESVANLALGSLPFAEIVPLYKVTHQFSTAFDNANGRARIVAVSNLTANSFASAVSSSSTNHNSLSGLQGGVAGEYFHISSSEYNDLIGTTEVASISAGLQSQINALSGGDLSSYTLLSTTANLTGSLQSQINALSGGDLSAYALNSQVVHLSGGETITGKLTVAQITSPKGTALANEGFGNLALTATTSGGWNTAVGYKAMTANLDGVQNVAVGAEAMMKATRGDDNVALGYYTLYNLTTGEKNIAIGTEALSSLTDGVNNIAIGANSLGGSTSDNENIVIGGNTGNNLDGGDGNILIGYDVAGTLATGSNNTVIGDEANTAANVSNSTAIGAGAVVLNSNEMILGNNAVTSFKTGAGASIVTSANISGYTTNLATLSTVANISGNLQTQITAIQGVTGTFATLTTVASISGNLQSQISAVRSVTGTFALDTTVATISGNLQTQITAIQGVTGTFALDANVVHKTTNETISGNKTFHTSGTTTFQGITSFPKKGTANEIIGASTTTKTTNTFSVLLGHSAGANADSQDQSTCLGYAAGQMLAGGTGNTLVGSAAGSNISTGGYNTQIGFNAGGNASGSSVPVANTVYVGAYAGLGNTNSDKLYICNAVTTSTSATALIYGDFVTGELWTKNNIIYHAGNLTAPNIFRTEVASISAGLVKKTGDTMTGSLVINKANPYLSLKSTQDWVMQEVDSDSRFRIYDNTGSAERVSLYTDGRLFNYGAFTADTGNTASAVPGKFRGGAGTSISIDATQGGGSEWRIGDGLSASNGTFTLYDYTNSRLCMYIASTGAITLNGTTNVAGNVAINRTDANLDLYINTAGAQTGTPSVTLRTDGRYDQIKSGAAGIELITNYSATPKTWNLNADGTTTVPGRISTTTQTYAYLSEVASISASDFIAKAVNNDIAIISTPYNLDATAYGKTFSISAGSSVVVLPAISAANYGQKISFYVPTTEAAATTHTVSCGVNDNLMGRGLAAGIVLLRTNRLTVEASADGWRKVSAELDTDWSTPAVTFITGTSVNPAKGTASTSKDELIWRRRGEMVQLRVNFKKVGVADDSSGTGAYRIACPFACATSQVTLDGLGLGVTTIDTHGICQVGNGSFTSSTPALATAIAVMASTATIQLSDTATYLGSVTTSMAGAMSFYFEASYPVANW